MKIIESIKVDAQFRELGSAVNGIHLLPETALILKNMPFFVPDYAGEVGALIQTGARIHKVGRSISPSYALRYIDSLFPVVQFVLIGHARSLIQQRLPLTSALGSDFSIELLEKMRVELAERISVNVDFMDESQVLELPGSTAMADIISESSRFYTLKNGDVILSGEGKMLYPISPNNFFTIRVNESDAKTIKIK